MTLYRRAPWLERVSGIEWVWLADPVQLWLPGVPRVVWLSAPPWECVIAETRWEQVLVEG